MQWYGNDTRMIGVYQPNYNPTPGTKGLPKSHNGSEVIEVDPTDDVVLEPGEEDMDDIYEEIDGTMAGSKGSVAPAASGAVGEGRLIVWEGASLQVWSLTQSFILTFGIAIFCS